MENQDPRELEALGLATPGEPAASAWWAGLEAQLQDFLLQDSTVYDQRSWDLLTAWAFRADASPVSARARQVLVFWGWLGQLNADVAQLVRDLQIPGALAVGEFVHQGLQQTGVVGPLEAAAEDVGIYAGLLADLTGQQAEALQTWCRQVLEDSSIQGPFVADCLVANDGLTEHAWEEFWAESPQQILSTGEWVEEFPLLAPKPATDQMPATDPMFTEPMSTEPTPATDPMQTDQVVDSVPDFFFDEPIGVDEPLDPEAEPPTKRRRLAGPEPTWQVRLTTKEWQLIAAARHQVYSPMAIGRALGISDTAVRNWLEGLKLKLKLTGPTSMAVLENLPATVAMWVQAGQLQDRRVSWPPPPRQ